MARTMWFGILLLFIGGCRSGAAVREPALLTPTTEQPSVEVVDETPRLRLELAGIREQHSGIDRLIADAEQQLEYVRSLLERLEADRAVEFDTAIQTIERENEELNELLKGWK